MKLSLHVCEWATWPWPDRLTFLRWVAAVEEEHPEVRFVRQVIVEGEGLVRFRCLDIDATRRAREIVEREVTLPVQAPPPHLNRFGGWA